jgi:hypothetical protein
MERVRENEGRRGREEGTRVHMCTGARARGEGGVTLAFSDYLRLFYVCVQAPPNVIKMFDAP